MKMATQSGGDESKLSDWNAAYAHGFIRPYRFIHGREVKTKLRRRVWLDGPRDELLADVERFVFLQISLIGEDLTLAFGSIIPAYEAFIIASTQWRRIG